jgi:hypothetical protein
MVPLILSPSPPGAGFISFSAVRKGRDSTLPDFRMKGGVAYQEFRKIT